MKIQNMTKSQLIDLIAKVRDSLPDEPETAIKLIDSSFKETEITAQNDFDLFYKAYPLKVNKKGALNAWNNAVLRGENPMQMIAGATFMKQGADMLKSGKIRFFPIPHPATYLNQNRFAPETIETMRKQYLGGSTPNIASIMNINVSLDDIGF